MTSGARVGRGGGRLLARRCRGLILNGVILSAAACGLAACGGSSAPSRTSTGATHQSTGSAPGSGSGTETSTVTSSAAAPRPKPLGFPKLTTAATSTAPTDFVPAVIWRGRPAVYEARRPGLGLLSINQTLAGVHLHSGTVDAGVTGYRFGPSILGPERRRVVAGFNGGFKLVTNSGGFYSEGRTGAPLADGLGSIVTYTDGTTDIGAWHQGVPAAGHRVESVRQNLHLLIDGGRIAANVGCLLCWGATLGGTATPARSGLGITAGGNLIWAGGESLSVVALAQALRAARVVRAVELDINPEWVAGYVYGHRGGRGAPAPVQVVPGQPGVAGQFLAPDSRDFFSVVAR